MFVEWTSAGSIVDYMVFARDLILKCEETYGEEEVERVLDACHALMNYGVDNYKKPSKLSPLEENERHKNWLPLKGKTLTISGKPCLPLSRYPRPRQRMSTSS